MKARNFKQAARMSLEQRWYPMAQAKTVVEMNDIYHETYCELCELQSRRGHDDCGRCPLNDKLPYSVCSKEYNDWENAREVNESFTKAHKAAVALVKRLEEIAGI